ncbi:hypothetical protein SteCoe_23739 [Stentor coeruleus]|uniref:Uncharacterized protein n=1 Tax=Stentor coeruleus TaxID=5963 RepID=A0A1R2BJ39_9CILI|nr:hypothetical protein SteCoe_23739 [Stentor coeruleus]
MENPFKKLSWSEGLASLSTSIVTNATRSSKNEKLQAIFDRQQAKNQMLIMENRVKQLKKAQESAEKEILEAKTLTIQAKKRIQQKKNKANEKLNYYQSQKEFEDSQRSRFNIERKQRRKNIKTFENRILKRRQKIVSSQKKRSEEWEDFRLSEQLAEFEINRKRRNDIKSNYVESLRSRCFSQRSQRKKQRDEYFASVDTEKRIQNEAICRVTELELEEGELIQELSKTIEMRNFYIENLNKIKISY